MRRRTLLAAGLVMLAAAGCGQGADVATPTTVATTTTEATTTTRAVATTVARSTAPRFPPAAQVRHGDRVFGVFVAVERTLSAPELARAEEELRTVGYPMGGGDVNCDQGARETLRLAPDLDYYTVAVYFRTRQEAQQFVDAFVPGVVGTAEVTAYCRDAGR